MHPGDRDMKEIVVKHLQDCPMTGVNIDVARTLLGPNLGSLKGKTVRRPNPHVPMTEFRQQLQVQSHLEMPRIVVQLGHTQRT